MKSQSSSIKTPHTYIGTQYETKVWLSRCKVKPSQQIVEAIDFFIAQLKDAGILPLMDAIYFLAADNYSAALTNLVQPAYDLIDQTGGGNGGKSNFGPGSGLTGGTNSAGYQMRFDTGFNPSILNGLAKYSLNNAHMSVWSTTATSGSYISNTGQTDVMGAYSTSSGTTFRGSIRLNSQNTFFAYPNSNILVQGTITGPPGLFAWTRTDATNATVFKDGSFITASSPVTGLPNETIKVFYDAGVYNSDPNTTTLMSFGAGLSNTQLSAYYDAASRLLISAGILNYESLETVNAQPTLPAYFTNTTQAVVAANNISGFRVYQQVQPPSSDSTTGNTYPYFPMSDAATVQIEKSYTGSLINSSHWLWQMRQIVPVGSIYNDRPNLQPPTSFISGNALKNAAGLDCWVRYSTLTTAIGATECQARWSLGYPQYDPLGRSTDPIYMGWGDCANYYGLPQPVPYDYAAGANTATFFPTTFSTSNTKRVKTCAVCTDQVILTPGRLVDVRGPQRGLALDCEAQDARTPDVLLNQIQRLAAICQAAIYAPSGKGPYEFCVYPNPVENAGAINTGFDITNLYQIHQTPGVKLVLIAWKKNKTTDMGLSIDNQENLLKGPNGDQPINYSNLILGVGMGTTKYKDLMTVNDATKLRSRIVSRNYSGVLIWKDYGAYGGLLTSTYNQVLATVLGLPTS
jgi:hypothetical protein